MAFLIPDRTKKIYAAYTERYVNEKIIQDNSLKVGKKLSDGSGVPRGITIHNTPSIDVAVGTNAAEQYSRATFNDNLGGVTVHYYG